MKLVCIALFSLLLVTQSYAQQPKPRAIPAADTTKWLTLTDTVYHFSVQYPGNWQLKLPETKTRFFITTYPENETDFFRENMNCIARVIDQAGFTIKTAETAVKDALAAKLKDYKLIRSGYSTWNQSETLELEYTCTQESGGNTYSIHMLQRMAVVKGTLFTLTYTAEDKNYKKYLEAVKKVVASLKIQ
jgi:hypothetical protein